MSRKVKLFVPLVMLATLAIGSVALLRRPPGQDCASLDPDRVAYLEKAGWEAYYDRAWLRVLTRMVEMNRTQFCMSWLDAGLAALDIVRAAAAFAPVDNDIPAATQHLARFYARARTSAGLRTDAATLAALELDYWIVHRKLAVARKAAPGHAGDIEPMVNALAKLHAALFAAPDAAIRRSAAARAQAAATVDRITGGYSEDVAADWRTIEQELRTAYRAVIAAPAAAQ